MGLTVVPGGRPETTGSPIREAVMSVSRAIEDLNWQNLSVDERTESDTLTYTERRDQIKKAREFVRKNPLAKQASNLLVNYVLGRGVALTAANKSLVGRLVDEFWMDPTNRAVFTSNQSMAEFLQGAFTDASQFLVLFPDKDEGTLHLGYLDALFVEDVIMDPQNAKVPKWYKVRKPKGDYDFSDRGTYQANASDEVVWYRHFRNSDALDSKGKKAPKKVEEGLIYQAKRGRGKLGSADLGQAAMDWLRAHKMFMEDRATLTRAAASIAWKKKRKNSSVTDIATEVERLQSSLTSAMNLGYENNPPPAAGSTVVENEASNLEWVKTDTGGQSALADERILRMMGGSSMGGIPNHYFGDEANANLATATSMELPLLKSYENWQEWLTDVIDDVIEFMLETAHEAGRIGERDDTSRYTDRSLSAEKVLGTPSAVPADEPQPAPMAPVAPKEAGPEPAPGPLPSGPAQKPAPMLPAPTLPVEQVTFSVPAKEPDKDEPVDWYVDVDFPPIVVKDIKPYFESLKILVDLMPGGPEATKMVISMALTALGVSDIDQVMGNLFPPLPEGAKPTPPLLAAQQGAQMGIPPGGMKLLGAGQQPPAGPMREAAMEMSPVRVHRYLSAIHAATMQAAGDN